MTAVPISRHLLLGIVSVTSVLYWQCRLSFCAHYRLHLDFLWLLFQGILQEAPTKTFSAITNCLTKSNGLVVHQE